MRYVMILTGDESNWYEPKLPDGLMDEVGAWWGKWFEAGKIVEGGAELQPTTTAKTVGRGRDGKPEVTDGPYLELKEVVGGFILLEADDIDDAVAVAAGWPGIAAVGDKVEVRPILER
ncbi:YciI family protein [Actinoplanes sp. DH11]|uniref:YciI family protein n=1 Tax=Actinoplanes sp. DH11 TaxID=2857011 RepID=UPI001E2B6357|nr:YciI family protein [Actinoplanes sp. DH11]